MFVSINSAWNEGTRGLFIVKRVPSKQRALCHTRWVCCSKRGYIFFLLNLIFFSSLRFPPTSAMTSQQKLPPRRDCFRFPAVLWLWAPREPLSLSTDNFVGGPGVTCLLWCQAPRWGGTPCLQDERPSYFVLLEGLWGHMVSFFREEVLCCCFKQYGSSLRGQWGSVLVGKQFIILNGIFKRDIIGLFLIFLEDAAFPFLPQTNSRQVNVQLECNSSPLEVSWLWWCLFHESFHRLWSSRGPEQ